MNSKPEPKLAKPGAGLPIPMKWIARILVPIRAKKSDWNDNLARFQRYSKAIEEIATTLTSDQLNTRFLVNPIVGLEDSSRYWSVGMTLDHIVIVSSGIKTIIETLSHSKIPPVDVRVEDVKPPLQEHEFGTVQRFSTFCADFVPTLNAGPDRLYTKLRHPWFGPFNAHQWLYIVSIHQGIHLQQIRQIVASIKK
ncbi:MAG: DinB family protein [Bdellovibrionales bacterium]|nr:DinB family protein [Bdellovibrionales bacterium]